MDAYADRLEEAVRGKSSPLCVGIDPRLEAIPPDVMQAEGGDPARALCRYGLEVIELVAPYAACVKPNVAFFEEHGIGGMAAYAAVCRAARERGLLCIGDVKRGDLAATAQAYARAHLRKGADFEVDAVTAHPYMGADSLEPLADAAARAGKGVYVLVRTSNAGAKDLQDVVDVDGEPLHARTAALVRAVGDGRRSRGGLSCVGAVVGATWPAEAARLRALLPSAPFLVPGYGAQGAKASDVAPAFLPGGRGAVVNASRSILQPAAAPGTSWRDAVVAAARQAKEELHAVALRA